MSRYEVHQTDRNAPAIYTYAEQRGFSVQIINRPLDALIGLWGFTTVAEVKMPRRKLRPGQAKFLREWKGDACVLRTTEDVDGLYERLTSQAKQLGKIR